MQSPGTLAARHVTKSFGARVVLEDVSLVVPSGARIGVVGPNGSGKSTLLRLLAGLEEPDAGTVERAPETLTVGYLPQEADTRPDEPLRAYLARRTGVAAAEARMDELARRLADEPGLAAAHADALERFLALGGEDLEARARAVGTEVGLEGTLEAPAGRLSGGQRARAALAAILLSRFDVLLLDEPTNDLDFAGLELLEDFLASTRSALVVVSHDRELLDRRVGRVAELEEGGAGLREWAGGYAEFEAARAQARRAQYQAHEQYVDEKARLEEQARRMSEWEERGYGQGRKKKKTKDAKGLYRRRIARLERVDKPFEPWELRLTLAPAERGGDVVARLDRAVVQRDGFRLGPVDLELHRGDRLALVGPNGSGKTTLIQTLLGRLPLAAGQRSLGAGVEAAELEQGREDFAGEEPLLARFRDVTALPAEPARTLLAKFGLGAEHVDRPCGTLSPGERTRAALAAFMARGVNLLVLDEPTNHLDLPAIEQLEEALDAYEGTVVLVTHDRRFLERFRATRELVL